MISARKCFYFYLGFLQTSLFRDTSNKTQLFLKIELTYNELHLNFFAGAVEHEGRFCPVLYAVLLVVVGVICFVVVSSSFVCLMWSSCFRCLKCMITLQSARKWFSESLWKLEDIIEWLLISHRALSSRYSSLDLALVKTCDSTISGSMLWLTALSESFSFCRTFSLKCNDLHKHSTASSERREERDSWGHNLTLKQNSSFVGLDIGFPIWSYFG